MSRNSPSEDLEENLIDVQIFGKIDIGNITDDLRGGEIKAI